MGTRYSQNFLVQSSIAQKIVGELGIKPGDSVLEIGPGRGILTDILLRENARLTVVEIDSLLAETLSKKWAAHASFRVIHSDFLDMKLPQDLGDLNGKIKIIGNLPYAVTSPILQKILEWSGWDLAVFMVQKEVADRICSAPGSKDYSVLTVSVQSRSSAEKTFNVAPGAFKPPPKVMSSVIRLKPLAEPRFAPDEEGIFFATAKAAFAQRRKMAANSLANSLKISAESARSALLRCGLSPTARAETFSVDDFARLARILHGRP